MTTGKLCMVSGGAHSFESYVTATLPPEEDVILAADVKYQANASEQVKILTALTAKRYLIACSRCGMVVGGHVGDAPPQVEVEEDPV